MANSLIENVQERRELAKLFKELKGSDDQSRINNIVIQIKQIVDDPARGFDSALVQNIKINLGKVTIPTGVILDKSLRQVDEVLKDYIEYIQKQKEAYEKEEQQLITDSDDSDKH